MSGWNERRRVTTPRRNTLFSRAASLLSADEVRLILNHYAHALTENQRRDVEHRAGELRSLNAYMTRTYYPRLERERRSKAQKKRWLEVKYGGRWMKKMSRQK